MVEDDVDESEHSPLGLDPRQPTPQRRNLVLLLRTLVKQVVCERELVEDGVGGSRLSSLLEGRVVDRIVASIAHEVEVRLPFAERAHPLGDDALDDESVEREVDRRRLAHRTA